MKKTRYVSLDVLRVLSIFLVVCIHCMALVDDAKDAGDRTAKVVSRVMNITYCGVTLFVMPVK